MISEEFNFGISFTLNPKALYLTLFLGLPSHSLKGKNGWTLEKHLTKFNLENQTFAFVNTNNVKRYNFQFPVKRFRFLKMPFGLQRLTFTWIEKNKKNIIDESGKTQDRINQRYRKIWYFALPTYICYAQMYYVHITYCACMRLQLNGCPVFAALLQYFSHNFLFTAYPFMCEEINGMRLFFILKSYIHKYELSRNEYIINAPYYTCFYLAGDL